MKSFIINIGRADVAEAEKKINEQLKSISNFSSLKITSNGQNTMAVVLYDGRGTNVAKPAVKIVEFSITNAEEAKKKIDAALDGLNIISVEPICVTDMNRLIVVYETQEEET